MDRHDRPESLTSQNKNPPTMMKAKTGPSGVRARTASATKHAHQKNKRCSSMSFKNCRGEFGVTATGAAVDGSRDGSTFGTTPFPHVGQF
jgi:hypothetical protein